MEYFLIAQTKIQQKSDGSLDFINMYRWGNDVDFGPCAQTAFVQQKQYLYFKICIVIIKYSNMEWSFLQFLFPCSVEDTCTHGLWPIGKLRSK